MKKFSVFCFLFLAFQLTIAQELWLKHIPIPKLETVPHFLDIYEDEKSVDFPKEPKGKTFKLNFKLTKAKFEGQYTDIRIANKTYLGLDGEVKFKNGDSYKGTLFFNWRRRFSEGVYTKKTGEKIYFFENGEPFNTMKYYFANGDSLVVDRSKQEGNNFYQLGTYYYKDASTMNLGFYQAYGYEGPVEYKGINGTYCYGSKVYRNEQGGLWKIIDDGTLTYLIFYNPNNAIGAKFSINRWMVIVKDKEYEATKLNEFTFCFDGNCQDGPAKLLFNKENQRGIAEVNFVKGKIQNPVHFIFYDDYYLMPQYKLTTRLQDNYINGVCDVEYIDHFHFTKPFQMVYKKGILTEGRVKLNNDVYVTFNPLEIQNAYKGTIRYANGHRYEGQVNENLLPEGKGTYYFSDVDYLHHDFWEDGVVYTATQLYKNKQKVSGIYKFSTIEKQLIERDIVISFEPTVTPKKAVSNIKFYRCNSCNGSGNSFMICPGCNGAGYNTKAALSYRQGGIDKCVYCKGSGKYPTSSCSTCNGTGEVYQD